MQPAPSEDLQTATSVESSSLQENAFHHGLSQADVQPSEGLSSSPEDNRGLSVQHDTVDHDAVASDDLRRGRELDVGRVSRGGSSSADSSPGSRIEAYEQANRKQRKPSDGMIFQIVPTLAGKKSSINVYDCPNEVLTHILSQLPPETLSNMSLVSRRFHKLVTTPPAWRIAFARYFPGSEAITPTNLKSPSSPNVDITKSERRFFTRLSTFASWRSEYILRTRLLRSLSRGKPAIQTALRSTSRQGNVSAAAVTEYFSGLDYPVNHLHATFGVGLNKKQPLFIHGASEQGTATVSDPALGKVSGWGRSEFVTFKHFADLFVGEVEYGLGPGNVVGMPNVMDVSQPYGKVYGEACPGGRLFFTSTFEQQGRSLTIASTPNHDLGIPDVTMIGCAITAVWIAKSESVLKVTGGLFGILTGFSNGVLAAYAVGINPANDRRFSPGESTAKWALCPGVPITAIVVDENINARRVDHHRVWAVVLNALGETFFLTDCPFRSEFKGKTPTPDVDRVAWQTGRSLEWKLIEATRRSAKPDPFNTALVDGSYSPRSSSDAQGLSRDQIVAETKEIERFLLQKPKHFQSLCDGWDMRRRLVVDFAGDDHHGGGESIFVIECGFDELAPAAIKRYTRCKTRSVVDYALDMYPPISSTFQNMSVFGSSPHSPGYVPAASPRSIPRSRTSSHDAIGDSFKIDWHISNFVFGYVRNVQISAVATDDSEFASIAVNEDPLLGMSGGSNTSSPVASPLGSATFATSPSEIPGRRARFMAVGTTSGLVLLWNMRGTISPAPDVINSIQPYRVIHTKSPQISSLALTALYVVHGGNDGLVQAWDPLVSTVEQIRTLNSRFSDRARRRIAQAEASIHGVGNNYYAAGAIVLDPDPTVLRGMVSLGTQLRYWSYSSNAADAYKSRKRGQLGRRSQRGSNAGTTEQRFHHTGRSVLKDYITNEKQELELEKINKRKELERLSGRFGTNLLGADASEEEILAYATMLSEESFAKDEERFRSLESSVAATPTSASFPASEPEDEVMDADMLEAIRLSLLDSEYAAESPQTTDFAVPIRYARGNKRGSAVKNVLTGDAQPGSPSADDDLDFALRLSLAEQQSRLDDDEFPTLAKSSSPGSDHSTRGKGKGRRR